MSKPKTCKECGQEGATGQSGRCSGCGMDRLLLTIRWSGVFSNMTNAQVSREVARLETTFGPGAGPRRRPGHP